MAVAVIGAVIAWLRVPRGGQDILYAEDGVKFIADWLGNSQGLLTAFEPYDGYQHFLPRISAGLVVLVVPAEYWAIAVTIAACLLAGASAAMVYLFSRDVIDTPVSRWGLAAITMLVPLAAIEPVGNLANLHWYLLYLVPWLLLAVPRSTAGGWAIAAIAVCVGLTEFQSLFFVPVAVLLLLRRPGARFAAVGLMVGGFAQLVTFLLAPRSRNEGRPPILSTLYGYLADVSLSTQLGTPDRVGGVIQRFGWLAGIASLTTFLALGIFAYRRGLPPVPLAVVVLLYGSVASWTASFVFNNARQLYYSEIPLDGSTAVPFIRWGMSASMMLAAIVPLAAGVLWYRTYRDRLTGIALLGLLIGGMTLGFVSSDNPRKGSAWSAQVVAARKYCADTPDGRRAFALAPENWTVTVTCRQLR